jgi:hypothetical protein
VLFMFIVVSSGSPVSGAHVATASEGVPAEFSPS